MPWDAQGRWIPEDDSVATRLTGMLGTNSTYMQQARAGGQRTAARRGLLNSSIAAGAGESAAIAAAAPIASQDAAQTFQRNQAVLEGGINYQNSSRLQQEQFAGQRGLNEQQNQQQLAVQAKEAEFQRQRDLLLQQGATESQLREFDQRTAEQIRGLDADAARQTAALQSNERLGLLSSDTNILQSQIQANSQLSSQYLSAFSQLANDPNIPAEVRNAYIAEFQRVMTQGQQLINVMRNTPLTWGPGAIMSTPTNQPLETVPYEALAA